MSVSLFVFAFACFCNLCLVVCLNVVCEFVVCLAVCGPPCVFVSLFPFCVLWSVSVELFKVAQFPLLFLLFVCLFVCLCMCLSVCLLECLLVW